MRVKGKIQKNSPRNKKKLTIFSFLARVFAETCTFAHIISLGSGDTETFSICGLLVNGVVAAIVTEVRSKKVTKPVDDIVAPTTLSIAESKF